MEEKTSFKFIPNTVYNLVSAINIEGMASNKREYCPRCGSKRRWHFDKDYNFCLHCEFWYIG